MKDVKYYCEKYPELLQYEVNKYSADKYITILIPQWLTHLP